MREKQTWIEESASKMPLYREALQHSPFSPGIRWASRSKGKHSWCECESHRPFPAILYTKAELQKCARRLTIKIEFSLVTAGEPKTLALRESTLMMPPFRDLSHLFIMRYLISVFFVCRDEQVTTRMRMSLERKVTKFEQKASTVEIEHGKRSLCPLGCGIETHETLSRNARK